MNSKNIKVVDEHGIDRNAVVMFGFELDGSGYVTYSIERDEENSNIFISKVLRNFDNTYSMMDIDDVNEKGRFVEIVKMIITNAVESQNDKNNGNTLTLNDGKVIKFMGVSFNKEQRINVQKTYITTVKKEVIRVVEKFYDLVSVFEQPKVVEDIFPSVTPVAPVSPMVENVETPVTVSTPIVEVMPENHNVDNTVISNGMVFGDSNRNAQMVNSSVNSQQIVNTVQESPNVIPTPSVVEPITVQPSVVESEPIVQSPQPLNNISNNVSEPLVFNASKEINLNEALGEVASASTIPVENIEPVREFGVEQPVVNQPVDVPVTPDSNVVTSKGMTNKGGFVNSKFFMVVAIAFFLASCIFLGYEVFNYFQLTK